MILDKVYLTQPQLGLIDHWFLSIRPNYAKRVTLAFTYGKSDDFWLDKTPTLRALTPIELVRVDSANAKCSASCVVDLWAALVDASKQLQVSQGSLSGPARTRKGRPDPAAFRRSIVLSVVHELCHIAQGWQIGARFVHDAEEEEISASYRAADLVSLKIDPLATPYEENVLEKGAFDFAGRWYTGHVREVNEGKFDFVLPRATVRGLFPDFPNAFK